MMQISAAPLLGCSVGEKRGANHTFMENVAALGQPWGVQPQPWGTLAVTNILGGQAPDGCRELGTPGASQVP